jgi:RNA polymerase sigma-70 factor, ECF subfamily
VTVAVATHSSTPHAAADWAAFERLVRAHHEALRLFAYRLIHDAASVDDVLQDAYVKAFRAFPGFSARPDAPKAWLFRIVYRCALDELQRRGRWNRRHDAQARELALRAERALADTTAERDAVARALDELGPEERAAVVLVDGIGLDYATAAAVVGVRRGTIASRLNRARSALRGSLRESGIVEPGNA